MSTHNSTSCKNVGLSAGHACEIETAFLGKAYPALGYNGALHIR